MAYTIVLSDGTTVTLVPDNTVNTTALPINLFGRGYVNYGMALNENFVFMLEHFSSAAPPENPVHGQLWYNNAQDVLNLWSVANVWEPIVVQNNRIGTEITVEDGNGNAAELDGTGALYLSNTSNPLIAFMNEFGSPFVADGTIIASITLTGTVLTIQPGLNVTGPFIVTGSANVSGNTSTATLNVLDNATANSLSVTNNATVNGDLAVVENASISGSLAVVGAITSSANITAQNTGGNNYSALESGGVVYIRRSNASDYAEIDFDDGTGLQGLIKLTNVGDSGWNANAPLWPGGETNPYVLVIQNGLDVIGNQLITGNLTVDGTITGGGAFLPLVGGTLTGNLIVDDATVTVENSANAVITLNGTTATTSQASLILEVNGYSGTITHFVNGGDDIIYIGPYGDGMFGVNMTAVQIEHYAPTVMDDTLAIWTNTAPSLGIYAHGTPVPTVMLCDPGVGGGHTIVAGGAMGVSLQLNSGTYSLQWGTFVGNTGLPDTDFGNLMNLNQSGALSVLGGVSTYGNIGGDNISSSGSITSGSTIAAAGNISAVGAIHIGATTINDGDFAASYTGGETVGNSGYQKLPGGLYMMWGFNNSGADGSPATINFPTPPGSSGGFPTNCFNVTATNSVMNSDNHINVHRVNNASFQMSNSAIDMGANDAAFWMAIGN
jgi:hypothetical protein